MFKAQLNEGRNQWYVANDSRILMPAASAEDACRIAAELNRIIAAPRRMPFSTIQAQRHALDILGNNDPLAGDIHPADAPIHQDNAKLRDLLRRVRGCFESGRGAAAIAVRVAAILPEIDATVEPSGNPGELEEK